MKVAALDRFPRLRKSEGNIPCHLAVFSSLRARERSSESRPKGKSDSSSSGTAAILCLQREGLADIGFSHQRVYESLSPNQFSQEYAAGFEKFVLRVLADMLFCSAVFRVLASRLDCRYSSLADECQKRLIQDGQGMRPVSRSRSRSRSNRHEYGGRYFKY